ncbi:signal transduction histidine kinase [Homoserinimonas aerilata]|uniref:histidine kinase n=1 Tax=Homoserinimonas aerilata TaxID=1162970 RepID=A0A542YIE8_9MICO|nr:ATP-binding protein [Homoserinimonas aerilata]TQL47869.1 signal transduction histidine kinase [Homoserinimonas aerilata]
MDIWLAVVGIDPVVLVSIAAAGILLALVFLALWVVALRHLREQRRLRAEAEHMVLESEEDLAEQSARMRMVRELQQLSIQSVTEIIRQADGARYKGEADPAAAVRSATAIADVARSTLAELRRAVPIMRQGESGAAQQPGIKTARELFRMMREAGLDVRFEETGTRFPLTQAAELAIYRILQESLTNALKYGGEGTEARVAFRWSAEGFNVLVDDDGTRAASRRAGADPNEISRSGGYTIEDDAAALTAVAQGPGITEMRERTELFGGVFTAYSVPGVGFSISAAFPTLRREGSGAQRRD